MSVPGSSAYGCCHLEAFATLIRTLWRPLCTPRRTCPLDCCREEHEFWRTFDFLPQWAALSPAEKLARLRDHACHELHFFVQQRDPELFQSAVLPLLQVHNRSDCCELALQH